jgi:hypothetical protein
MALVTPRTSPRLVALALLSIAIGAALRLAWPADMEFKGDERYVFERTQLDGGWWPALGMPSSVGLRNPAMSVWVFVLLARAFRVTTAPGLGLAVMGLNVAALVLLFAFAMTFVAAVERDRWLWGLMLVAVNPLAVLLERKIWAPSVFPAFVLVFWAGWWRRHRAAGAFAWGLAGVLLGQIHMSGFFFAAGVLGWEAVASWRGPNATARAGARIRWGAWLAGSALGALPMIPWLVYFVHRPHSSGEWDWRELVTPRFWLYGLTEPLGLGLHYSLGLASFLDFLGYPRVAGIPTYLVGLAHAGGALAGAGIAAHGLGRAWRARRSWRSAIGATESATGTALRATFIAYGALLTLTGLVIYRHYLLVTYPLGWVLLAGLALSIERHGRRLLGLVWASQLVITLALLLYLHAHGGAPGDYGVAYRLQPPGSASDAAARSQVAPSR